MGFDAAEAVDSGFATGEEVEVIIVRRAMIDGDGDAFRGFAAVIVEHLRRIEAATTGLEVASRIAIACGDHDRQVEQVGVIALPLCGTRTGNQEQGDKHHERLSHGESFP